MKEFEASRLSDGNKLMPNKVSIDDFGVTLRIPGVFSGKEKTLTYHDISSVKIETPMVGFSTITFNTKGWDDLVAKGFSKDQAQEIKQLVQLGISGVRGGGGGSNSSINSVSNQPQAPVKTAEQVLAESQASLEQQKYDDEQAEKRRLQELEDKKAKQKRADELRAQGKNTQAFFLEHGKTLGIIGGLLVFGIIGLCVYMNGNGNEKLDADLTRKAEKVETLIHDGKKEEASKLIEELQHDSQSESKHSSGLLSNYTYFEYWSKRRNELKKLTDNMPTIQSEVKEQQPTQSQPEVQQQQQPEGETQQQPTTPDYSNFIGEWKGSFGNDKISIVIEKIDSSNGMVVGYNIVKNNKRTLYGTLKGENEFELNEPGDDKWDGKFKFSISNGTATGAWASNNGKSTKNFSLVK